MSVYNDNPSRGALISMVVIGTIGIASGLFFFVSSLRRPHRQHARITSFLLIPASLLMVGQHVLAFAVGVKFL